MSCKTLKSYAKELLHLALPIIMGQIGFVLIMAGDVFVAAKYSTDVLAATSISNSITSIIFMFGIGLLISVSPVLSNKLGERKSAKKFFYPTVKFSLIASLLTTIAIIASIPLICALGFEEKLLPDIRIYTFIIAFSTFGGFLYAGLKEFLQAYEIVFVPNFIAIAGILLNLGLNWIFAFGWGVIPSMGIAGLAIASVITRILMALALLIFCFKNFDLKSNREDYNKYYLSLIKVGLPISLSVCIEFLAFNSMAILMGRVSGTYAAAQNIINVISSTSFMIPLSISNAIAVKVGFANGAKNYSDVKKYSLAGCLMSVGFMACCGIIFASFPSQIAGIFTSDKILITIITQIMIVVACFQVSDGLQVSLGGIYKGLKKTNLVMIANFLGYTVFGIPFGAFLAFKLNLNLFGFWIGIASASAILCFMLLIGIIITFKNSFKENPSTAFCKTPQDDLNLIK